MMAHQYPATRPIDFWHFAPNSSCSCPIQMVTPFTNLNIFLNALSFETVLTAFFMGSQVDQLEISHQS
jgi:hypothetical protein